MNNSEPPCKRLRQTKALEVDGSVLEGGGQILRMSGAYSALFNIPIHISKIRAGRSKPGLAAQHLESLRLVRDVSGGALVNDRIGSCDITLNPGLLAPGRFSADPGTAGAITLMVQASLFPLFFAGGPCTCDLRGGTDVAYSPPLDFLTRVLQPMIKRMGASFDVNCTRRGVFPKGGGHILLQTSQLHGQLQPIDLGERGDVSRVRVMLYATRDIGTERKEALEVVRIAAQQLAPVVHVDFGLVPAPERTFKYWANVVVETTTGALFHGGSEPTDIPGWNCKMAGLFATAMKTVCKSLSEQLASGAAVDVHLSDQLILPASLAAGKSRLLASELSLHARTAIHIAKLFVPGVKFNEQRRGQLILVEIDGVGHVAGESALEPSSVEMASPTPTLASNKEWIQLKPRTLSGAAQELLQDFRKDLKQVADDNPVVVTEEVCSDRLLLHGGERFRANVKPILAEMLEYYFGAEAIVDDRVEPEE